MILHPSVTKTVGFAGWQDIEQENGLKSTQAVKLWGTDRGLPGVEIGIEEETVQIVEDGIASLLFNFFYNIQPLKTNGWNLKITQLKRKII